MIIVLLKEFFMITMAQKYTRARYVRSGFSLMEIMIAITILGLVMTMVIPAITNQLRKAQKRTAVASLKGFKSAIAEYHRETGQYPSKLRDLIKKPANVKDWDGPYLEKEEIPQDPWKHEFKYKVTPGAKHPYELHSWGPNDQGSPKDEWISVWEEPSKKE
jgi:general secretion pathway protein G